VLIFEDKILIGNRRNVTFFAGRLLKEFKEDILNMSFLKKTAHSS